MSVRVFRWVGSLAASSLLILGSTAAALAASDPDPDGDGFVGTGDLCPALAGPVNGCPDGDNDGVPDHEDLCPTVAGTIQGCPQGNHGAGTESDAGDLAETTVTADYQGRSIRGSVTSTDPACTRIVIVDLATLDALGQITEVLGNLAVSRRGTYRLDVSLPAGTRFRAFVSGGVTDEGVTCPSALSSVVTVAAKGKPGR